MKKTLAFLLCLALVLPFLPGCSFSAGSSERLMEYDIFDSYVALTLYGQPSSRVKEIGRELFDYLKDFSDRIDTFDSHEGRSELFRLNEKAGEEAVELSPDVFELLAFGKEGFTLSGERVNIMLGAVTYLWKDLQHLPEDQRLLPDSAQLEEAGRHCRLSDLELSQKDSSAFIKDPLARVDIGAIAKGFAGRLAREWLQKKQIENYLLDIGGTILCGGTPLGSGRDYFLVGLQKPDSPDGTYERTMELRGGEAIATSGIYHQSFRIGEATFHHIIDPSTLQPSKETHSASVLHEDPALCDLLSTACFLTKEEDGKTLAKSLGGTCIYQNP